MKALLAGFLFAVAVSAAQAQSVKTVGPGAVSCQQFNQDYARDPYTERGYFAWAQGLMSGVLLRAPQGVDEDLDLTPPGMPVLDQMAFIRRFCTANPDSDYTDATLSLYKELRKVNGGS